MGPHTQLPRVRSSAHRRSLGALRYALSRASAETMRELGAHWGALRGLPGGVGRAEEGAVQRARPQLPQSANRAVGLDDLFLPRRSSRPSPADLPHGGRQLEVRSRTARWGCAARRRPSGSGSIGLLAITESTAFEAVVGCQNLETGKLPNSSDQGRADVPRSRSG